MGDLSGLLEATRRIAVQTRQRVAGVTPDGASRRVRLHDSDARPIANGRLGKPVEFGHKGQVVDNDDGVSADPGRGHAFVQNLRRGHYEIATDEPAHDRLRIAFAQLAPCI